METCKYEGEDDQGYGVVIIRCDCDATETYIQGYEEFEKINFCPKCGGKIGKIE